MSKTFKREPVSPVKKWAKEQKKKQEQKKEKQTVKEKFHEYD